MITSSYRPGDWFGVFGDATTLLLPASEKARVAELWSRVDEGAGFDEVLDALLQSGLGALPGFVLVSGGDGPTKLLARGAVLVTGRAGGEDVQIDGRDALTWVERTLDDVEALTLSVGDAETLDDGDDELSGRDDEVVVPDLPIVGGLVRVSRVDQPAVGSGAAAPAPAASVPAASVPAASAAAVPVAAAPADDVAVEQEVGPEPDDELGDAPHGVPADDVQDGSDDAADDRADGIDDAAEQEPPPPDGPLDQPIDVPAPSSVTTAPMTPPTPAGLPPTPPPPPAFADDPLSGPLPPEAGPLPPEATEVPAAAEHPDHDGMTRSGAEGEEFERELPGIPGQPQAPRVVAPVAKLVVSNGEVVEVDRVILIGRAPEARRFTSTDQPRLLKVPSPLHEISSTHVEVRPGSGADHGSAVVTDMGSTNGTVVDQPGLGPESLKAGIAVQLIPGATINLGDGVTIQVTRP